MAPHGLAEEPGTRPVRLRSAICWHGTRCAHTRTLPNCKAAVPLASCGCGNKDLVVLQLDGVGAWSRSWSAG